MLKNITTKKALIITIILVVGVVGLPIAYFSVSQARQQSKLKKTLNTVVFDSSYKLVSIRCGDVELRQECSKAYYVSGDIAAIETATLANLKSQGFNFEKIPGGYDGPDSAYRTQRSGDQLVIKFVNTNNQSYKERMGNIQLKAY
jgi:hypothetical protein